MEAVARKLGTPAEMLFGRLYYGMVPLRRRSPSEPRAMEASIFEPRVGERKHCVNFPYLAVTPADLEAEHRRSSRTFYLAIAALVVSAVSVAVTYHRRRMLLTDDSASVMEQRAAPAASQAGR
jgi:hypothetical protein